MHLVTGAAKLVDLVVGFIRSPSALSLKIQEGRSLAECWGGSWRFEQRGKHDSRLGEHESKLTENVVGLVDLMKDPLEIFGHEFQVKLGNKVTCPPARFRCSVLTWSSAEKCI